MRVILNGDAQQLPDGLTVRGMLEHLRLTDGPVAVEINREIVPRAEHPTHTLKDGDAVEIVHLVGGG